MKYEITIQPMHSLAIQTAFRRARIQIGEMRKFAADHNLQSCIDIYDDNLRQMAEIDAIIDAFWDDLDINGKKLIAKCKTMGEETNVTAI